MCALLGRWHEVARLDHRLGHGLVQVTTEYAGREDGGIAVRNRGWHCKDRDYRAWVLTALVASRMRAVSGAFFLFRVNLVGMGLGPQTVGFLSDSFAPEYGKDSLRPALMIVGLASVRSALHFWRAARHLAGDARRLHQIAAT